MRLFHYQKGFPHYPPSKQGTECKCNAITDGITALQPSFGPKQISRLPTLSRPRLVLRGEDAGWGEGLVPGQLRDGNHQPHRRAAQRPAHGEAAQRDQRVSAQPEPAVHSAPTSQPPTPFPFQSQFVRPWEEITDQGRALRQLRVSLNVWEVEHASLLERIMCLNYSASALYIRLKKKKSRS